MKAFLILFLFPLKIFAQDITGVWTGTLYNDTTKRFVPYEITISEEKGRLTGYSHTTWKPDNVDDVVNIGLKAIKLKRRNNTLYVEDEKWLYNNYPEPPPKGVKQYSVLDIQTGDAGMVMSGPFNTNRTKEYAPATGTIRLTKKNDFSATQIIPKLKELNLLNTLSFLPAKTDDKGVMAIVYPPEKPVVKIETSAIPKNDPDLPKTIETIPEKMVTVTKKPTTPPVVQTKKEDVAAVQKPIIKVPANITEKPKQQVVVPIAKPIIKTVSNNPPPKPVIKAVAPKQEIKTPVVAAKQQEVVAPKIIPVSAADLASRKIETIRSVIVKTDSLVLNLYDNGEVDGDTVSVVLNGKTIISRQGLTTNAITKVIYLTPDMGDSLQLIMYAENLGSIPPNTGLLILQDGNDRYEIRFAGDLQKNSAIILRRKH